MLIIRTMYFHLMGKRLTAVYQVSGPLENEWTTKSTVITASHHEDNVLPPVYCLMICILIFIKWKAFPFSVFSFEIWDWVPRSLAFQAAAPLLSPQVYLERKFHQSSPLQWALHVASCFSKFSIHLGSVWLNYCIF